MNNIRIFYAVRDYFPPWRSDLHELFVKQMPHRGFDVTWSTRFKGGNRRMRRLHDGQMYFLPIQISGSNVLIILINKILQYIFETGLIVYLLVGPRYEIIQIRDRCYYFFFFARFVAWVRRSKLIYWCSYPFPEALIEQSATLSEPNKTLYRLRGLISCFYLFKIALPLSDYIFVQSEQMLEEFAGRRVPKEKMTAVPMGVPQNLLDPAHPARSARVVSNRIAYLGCLGYARRLETLIDAFALVTIHVPSASLVMVGDGNVPADRLRLESYVRAKGLSSRVEFTGQLPSDVAWHRIGEASVCVSPIYPSLTLRQGSPTKLFEYMALGKPIVANDHPEQSKVLAETGVGLCVSWDAEAFADAICKLLADPERASARAARGPGWIAAHRTYDLLADMVYENYRRIRIVV